MLLPLPARRKAKEVAGESRKSEPDMIKELKPSHPVSCPFFFFFFDKNQMCFYGTHSMRSSCSQLCSSPTSVYFLCFAKKKPDLKLCHFQCTPGRCKMTHENTKLELLPSLQRSRSGDIRHQRTAHSFQPSLL